MELQSELSGAAGSDRSRRPHVVITGANRGIGLEFTRQYLARGASVTAARRSCSDALDQLATRYGDRLVQIDLDLCSERSIESFVGLLTQRPIDLLINNAAYKGIGDGGLESLASDQWLHTLQVNVVAQVVLTSGLIPNLCLSDRPRVVFLSSIKGSIGRNRMGKSYPYRTSKAALNAATRSLALDLRPHGIVCIALSPGWVDQGERFREEEPLDRRLRIGRLFLAEFRTSARRLQLEESVAAMIAVTDSIGPKVSGAFLDHFGEVVEW